MSIFKSLFSSEPDEEPKTALLPVDEPSRQPESAPTGELFEGMRLEVMNKEGDPLLSGRVIEFTPETITLGRLPGELSFKISNLGTEVSLSGYDKKLIPLCLSATVQESTRISFKVKNVRVERHSENRDNFRLPYSTPVNLYRREDTQYKNPEECTLVNISTGGCCVQSEYIHMEDEVLRIRVKLDDYAPLSFLGQVIRGVEHSPGQFRYGILFAQLTEQEITSLSKTLYNLQMGIKETRMRRDGRDRDRGW